MSATDAQVAQVRRMTSTLDSSVYTAEVVATYIERYPLLDALGEVPYTWDTSTSPPTQEDNDDWIPTYDLNAAAADVWGEKAGGKVDDFTFNADGASYNLSDVIKHYQERERYYRSRRAAKGIQAHMYPEPLLPNDESYIGNKNDPLE